MSTEPIHDNMQERTMDFIPTTATAAEKMKREAKTIRKTTNTSLAVALDSIARKHGYVHWKHVTFCLEETPRRKAAAPLPPLPRLLAGVLDDAIARGVPSRESLTAFEQGFAFAMDVKDAESIQLSEDFAECDDAWPLGARELWRTFVHREDEETGETLSADYSDEELLEASLEDIQNYRFFRFVGSNYPSSLGEAFGEVRELCFFPPTHIWLNGEFFDLFEQPEIRVNGVVAFSTSR